MIARAHWLVVAGFALSCASAALAQRELRSPVRERAAVGGAATDATTEKPTTYADLRDSDDRATKALADRYHQLVGLQAWTDASGQHSRNARYVEHDPDLKWVKLGIVTGSGDDRSVREATVQLSKLNKVSQSRVRQIAALRRKLDELLAAESTDGATASEGGVAGEYGRSADGRGRGDRDLGRREGVRRDDRSGVDPTRWASSYAAFRANFTLSTDGGQKSLNWGELEELRMLNDSAVTAAESERGEDVEPAVEPAVPQTSDALGEVKWRAPFLRVGKLRTGEGEVRFRLRELPRPLKIRFLLDEGESIDTWSKLAEGEPVQFAGRLEIGGPNVIFVRVRLMNSARAGAASVEDLDANPLEELVDQIEAQ